jgi:hypothetical protein
MVKYYSPDLLNSDSLSEVGIAKFFLSPLIAKPQIFFESAKR